MRIHLYEFRESTKKVRCSCGWERTVKKSDAKTVSKKFNEHCLEVMDKRVA